MSFSSSYSNLPITLVVLNNLVSVREAAELSGYSMQYLRRLLRSGHLSGRRVGTLWLLDLGSINSYLQQALHSMDRRCGPRRAGQLGLQDREYRGASKSN